jgi:hypothetical protein
MCETIKFFGFVATVGWKCPLPNNYTFYRRPQSLNRSHRPQKTDPNPMQTLLSILILIPDRRVLISVRRGVEIEFS